MQLFTTGWLGVSVMFARQIQKKYSVVILIRTLVDFLRHALAEYFSWNNFGVT
jgi:apolipoprotein N-acyltransferase